MYQVTNLSFIVVNLVINLFNVIIIMYRLTTIYQFACSDMYVFKSLFMMRMYQNIL